MKEEELRRCQIQEWYPLFKPYSIRTLFHPLPDDYIRYILGEPTIADADADDDSDAGHPPPFILPLLSSGRDPLPSSTATIDPISILDSDPSSFNDGSDSESEICHQAPSFPDLESVVEQSIAALGGAVFPKLNWSSPKDAMWISAEGTLRCTSFADISLLLHSSDCAVHDLCHAAESCSDRSPSTKFSFFLALRKFYPGLNPQMEFRCFVRERRLIGICQRDVTAFYPSLVDSRRELREMIEDFFDRVVKPRFALKDYTFDVYVTENGKVKILDFNPWVAYTLPLLFSWDELEKEGFGEEEDMEFRLVESQCGIRPGLKTAVPAEYLDTEEGSAWDQFLRKANDELMCQMKNEEP